jgi:hypothetical protein
MENRLEQIVRLRFGIKPEPKVEGKEPIDLAAYPWDECVADQTERYGDEETAKKVCGAIKAMYGSKQEMEITPNPCWDGYEPIGLKDDGSPNCVPIKEKMGVVKEGFPVPSPSGDEDENKFISRCISELYDEYGQEQAAAICYSKWREK